MAGVPRPGPEATGPTYADCVVQALAEIGVARLFGMPGGGSNADLIEAAGRSGLPFSLAQTETGSAFMASAQAELTGRPGACLATLGPGAASLTNGVANAHLDRVPLLVLTDCRTDEAAAVMQHQTLAHDAIFGSLVKLSVRPRAGAVRPALRAATDAVLGAPPGPVHIDLAAELTSAEVPADDVWLAAKGRRPAGAQPGEPGSLSRASEALLRRARRPVMLIGLGARTPAIADAARALAARYAIPALVTYKAKGVVPDRHPWCAGVLTNGALERDVLERADAFIAVGLDPVELLPRPWTSTAPMIALTPWPLHQSQLPLCDTLVGDVVTGLAAVGDQLGGPSDWDGGEVRRVAAAQRERMRPAGDSAQLLPHRVVELAAEVYGGCRITVDAGAHMFPVMSLWPAGEPGGVLISNGLATMGFALPAAIGAALIDRARPTVAFTGDGGLLMCLAELQTAARERVPVRVIVFDDGALSLIEAKQRQRGYAIRGVSMGETRWEHLGAGFGVPVRTACDESSLRAALRDTVGDTGPVLIAARIAAQAYLPTMRALRG